VPKLVSRTVVVLVDRVLSLTKSASPSETVILKLAAALIKQIDQEYDVFRDSDPRIKIPVEQFGWIPDRFEIFDGIPAPKDW
jgi:hypothetical protein